MQKTFSWIFEASSASTNESHPSVKFVEWLQSEGSLYWISGKPGSGMSILMKYLLGHWLTQRNLDVWAEDYQLITASFFWNAGRISLQKSQAGMLRSLLYQILRQSPELIPYAFPTPWRVYISGGYINHDHSPKFLTPSELLAAFQRISIHLANF